MKELLLKELTLSNWKGQNRKVNFNTDKTIISAENGAGKTSLYNALVWLFTSYTDAVNNKNHELYDNTQPITEKTPEASVKALISIDGIEYTIERRAKANFNLNKETGLYEKASSDSYTILLDNIETSASNFYKFVKENIGDTDLLLYALVGERFANLAIDDKKKARKVLEMISGEVKYSDFTGDYSVIKEDIDKYSIEQLKERYKNQIKPLNVRIDEIETCISQYEAEIAEYKQVDYNNLLNTIDGKTKEIEEIDKQILGYSDIYAPIQQKRGEIMAQVSKLSLELSDKKNKHNQKEQEKLFNLNIKIKEVDSENKSICSKNDENDRIYQYKCKELKLIQENLKTLNEQREKLLKQRDEIKSRVFQADKCAYCGQELPFELLEELKEKFNENKKKELESVIENGKAIRKNIELYEQKLTSLQNDVNIGVTKLPLIDKRELEEQYNQELAKIIKFEDTEEYRDAIKEINDLKLSMPEIKTFDTSDLVSKKYILMTEIKELSRKYGMKEVIERLKKNIEQLNEERKNVCIEIALIQGLLAKLVEYEEEKAAIVSDRINKKLIGCKVVMYSRQKNGDLIPDCVIVDDKNVKYSTINNSNRIKICLSLQTLFSEHFGIKLPVFVDEASIFTKKNLPVFDRQTIYLYADDVNEMIIL